MKCDICRKDFEAYEGMRTPISEKHWCKTCQDEFDNIDWDAVAERKMNCGEL